MSKTGIIVQARMGSSRLPGKVLMNIGNHKLLDHIMLRLELLDQDVEIVVATTQELKDDVIAHHCEEKEYNIFRGDEEDVLGRYYACAMKYGFENIVRLTADNPFTDVDELSRLIKLHLENESDYTHSFGKLPLGVGAEVFSFSSLEKSFKEGKKQNHREHVNEYIQENPEIFSIEVLSVPQSKIQPDLRLTVDTADDYERACSIVEHFQSGYKTTTKQAIEYCLESV